MVFSFIQRSKICTLGESFEFQERISDRIDKHLTKLIINDECIYRFYKR